MTRPTLATQLATMPNNIDLLRLVGAIVVLFHHSFILTGLPDDEPTAKWLNHATDSGTFVVGMFFTFSGFLVSRSALRSPPRRYFRARALRIYPAFLAVILLQVFLLGPLLSTLGPVAYLTDAATWRALLRSLVFSPPLGLPGVFPDNPVPDAVNGSLWTLRFEASLWVVLAILAPLGLLRRGPALVLAIAAAATVLPAATRNLPTLTIAAYCTDFFAGVALFAWRDVIPYRGWIAALAALVLWAGCFIGVPGAAQFVTCLTLPYIVLYLGLCRPWLRLPDDISYGSYLYAFPIQQVLVAWLGTAMGPWMLTAVALPLTALCAIVSRRLIERPTAGLLVTKPLPASA